MAVAAAPAIVAMSATDIAQAVRRGELTPVTVVQAHLERIRAFDSQLRAFQVVREASAVADAEALGARSDLSVLPLAGVPVAIKDNTDVEGLPTRLGSAATSDVPAAADDLLVRRLRAAGCLVIGKTRMPELAIWPFTESAAFGETRNPWNPSKTPGGSSGGGAVAVATGMAALALGSDGGGSIRIPAACCGIFGLKPAPGLVPLAGGAERHWLGLSAFGPMSRTVADAALMLDILSDGERFRDVRPPARPLRIAVSWKHPALGRHASPAVVGAVKMAARTLASAGHEIRVADPPYPLTPLPFLRRFLGGIAEDGRGLPEVGLEPRTQSMVRAGRALQRMGLVEPAATSGFSEQMTAWFGGRDLLLTPVVSTPIPHVAAWSGKGWIRTSSGVAAWMGFTPPWNLAGFPAASVPAGRWSDGVPMAVQLVAPPGGEALLLSVAAELERAKPWPLWRPASGR